MIEHWGVKSEDGATYRVGVWRGVVWYPGSRRDAEHEAMLLRTADPGEPGAYAVRIEAPGER